MKHALVMAGALALLALPVAAQSPQGGQNNPPSNASQSSQNAPSTADFVKDAAISDMFEIQSSELALRKHARPDRRFAARMVHDHEQTSAQLKRLVRRDRINAQIPTKLDDEHQKMLDQLRGESGQQFDKDYDQMQQQGHEQAVSLFKDYSQSGDNQALKRWAARTLPKLEDHLSMAQKLPS